MITLKDIENALGPFVDYGSGPDIKGSDDIVGSVERGVYLANCWEFLKTEIEKTRKNILSTGESSDFTDSLKSLVELIEEYVSVKDL